ncbi:MAG: HAMP domain-containing histidine kinase [Planctomycetes bacterium]|nr:HAMP domain-containing histidine kinase [Planctomycetota bacterium]
MKRPLYAWTILGLCLSAMVAGVAWLTIAAWRAEHDRQQALLDSDMRNALWRLDSLAAPLLAIEMNRPSYSVPLAGTPLLARKLVRGYVVRDVGGNWTIRTDARTNECAPLPEDSQLRTADWSRLIPALEDPPRFDPNLADDGTGTPLIEWPVTAYFGNSTNYRMANGLQRGNGRTQAAPDPNLNRVVQEVQQLATQNTYNNTAAPPTARLGPLHPVWVDDDLVLARWLPVSGSMTTPPLEICWLDWPEWKALLEAELAQSRTPLQLVPDKATDTGAEAASMTGNDWRMITLPVRLAQVPHHASGNWPWPLMSACALLVVVALGFGWLTKQTLALSERRAAFVSAVTHELRTPLTTFRLYTEMLAEGLTVDSQQQQTYFDTLHREANRLTHLVENVLAYARLEHGRSTSRNETVTVGDLFDRSLPRLRQRTAETPLVLELDLAPEVRPARLTTNTLAVEQILFNLIDNACKYASTAQQARIECRVELVQEQWLSIRVADFGPGLSHSARGTLFESFRKSAAQAADSAPGIGLGLSLSHRLARELRGELQYRPHVPSGAEFEIRLPLTTA